MLNVTPSACTLLRDLLERKRVSTGKAVRIVVKGSGLGTTIDALHDGDAVVRDHDRPLLLMDPRMAERLADCTLDVEPDSRALLLV
jgi:hypothetical protein